MAIAHPEFDHDRFAEWTATRPPVIQEMIKSHPPDLLYRMKSTDHRVTLYSYAENRTVTVLVLGKYNRLTIERKVFGIPIDDLEECDLPGPHEQLGALYTKPEDIDAHIERMRDGKDRMNLD